MKFARLTSSKTKKKLLTAAAAIWLCAGTAFASPLTAQDKEFVVAALSSLRVLATCTGYEPVPDSFQTFGDRLGVDSDAMGEAVIQAVRMLEHMDYDRSRLIPWVTRLILEADQSLRLDIAQNQAAFCTKWGSLMIDRGLIQRKPRE
jgi:hypothetical protein